MTFDLAGKRARSMQTSLEVIDLEEERDRQRGIVDLLLGDGNRKEEKKYTSPQKLARRHDPKIDHYSAPKLPSLAGALQEQTNGEGPEVRSTPTTSRETYYHVPSDISTLFSGQPFSFLSPASGDEKSDGSSAADENEAANGCAEDAAVGVEQERTLFFFHWGNPQLANRLENMFLQSSVCEEVEKREKAWPEHRTALKQLLRHRHRRAVKEGRRRKRTQQAVV